MTAGKWIPLLEGEDARQAIAAAREIADRELPPTIEGGLYNGLAGVALLHGYLAALDDDDDRRGRAIELLAAAPEKIGDPPQIGLAWGVAGLAWTIHHLRRLGVGDVAVDETLDEFLLDQVRESPWDHPFDLTDGLAGIGLGVVDRLSDSLPRAVAEQVLARLEENALARPVGKTFTFMSEDSRGKGHPEEAFVGPAHGASGVVALLSRFIAYGFEIERARRLIDDVLAWMLDSRVTESMFLTVIRGEKRSDKGVGWCHGNVGIGSTLHASALKIGRADLAALAVDTVAGSIGRMNLASIPQMSFCHGVLGHAHMYARAFASSRRPELRNAACAYYQRGLQNWRRDGSNPLQLLQGLAGSGLALLAAATPLEPDWDSAFALS